MEDLRDLIHCCAILHNMTVEARFGYLGVEEEEPNIEKTFPLFGRQQITPAQAAADGIDLFSARMAAFDTAMQSSWKHFQLKKDLVEHIKSLTTT